MSQASKHIEWCIKKAEKEIEERKEQGLRPKHRGLIKITPSFQEAENHLNKALENLNLAISIKDQPYSYMAISFLFYCFYKCFLSIAAKFGYESGNQTCTIALIEYLKEE